MSNNLIRVAIAHDDPIFRLGWEQILARHNQIKLVWIGAVDEKYSPAISDLEPDLALISNDYGLDSYKLIQALKNKNTALKTLLLVSRELNPRQLEMVKTLEIEGYLEQRETVEQILTAMTLVMAGETFWPQSQSSPVLTPKTISTMVRAMGDRHRRLIDNQLWLIDYRLEHKIMPLLTKVVLQGQQRELKAARAVVNYLLPPAAGPSAMLATSKTSESRMVSTPPNSSPSRSEGNRDLTLNPNLNYLQPILKPTLLRLMGSMVNLTGNSLELDILKADKKRELIYIVFQEFEQAIEQLQLLQISTSELSQNYISYLREIWHSTTTKFLTKYYFLEYPASPYNLPQLLLQESAAIEEQVLTQIPYTQQLLAYLLWQHPLELDHIPYRFNSPEANQRAELLFQNLILRISNGVIQTILNNFANNEVVKHQLIDSKYTSTRTLTKFRNNISREYRNRQWWHEPIAIFESEYQLVVITNRGLEFKRIYGARQQELEQLRGIPLGVTFLLETKDTLQPVFKAFIAWIGSSLVYVLTQVLGRGLGLIGRGLLQAIGHNFQENQK